MAITFLCPECQALNTFEDGWASMRAPCKRCGKYITVPDHSTVSGDQIAQGPPPTLPASSGPPPLPREAITDAPRPFNIPSRSYPASEKHRDEDYNDPWRHRRGLAPGWNTVRIGLGMIYWGTVAIFLGALVFIIMAVVFGVVFRPGPMGGPGAENLFMGLLALGVMGTVLIAGLVCVVGVCMCCAAPPEARVRGQAITSVICLGLTVVFVTGLFLASFSLTVRGPFRRADPTGSAFLLLLLGLATMIVGILQHVFLILFLRGTATNFGNNRLAQSTSGYFALYFVTLGLNLLQTCLSSILRDPSLAILILVVALAVLVMGIVVLVWFLRLVADTRATIAREMR